LTTILGIESSFDDTAAAVVRDGKEVLSNVMASQVHLFKDFGGVVPEISSRAHIKMLLPVLQKALDQASCYLNDVDAIAVTYGPGLVGSLLVGLSVAKGISYASGLPLYGINHVEAHLYAPVMAENDLAFPHVCLSAAGGHTALYLVEAIGKYRLLGSSRDDAAGEAFDKVSVAMGRGCPGGREIEQLAKAATESGPDFPRPMIHSGNYDFSFSGLKTSVVKFLRETEESEYDAEAVAAAFQRSAIDVLVTKALRAAKEHRVRCISLTGGVACNTSLFDELQKRSCENGIKAFRPPASLCTDNAAMIAGLAFHKVDVEEPTRLNLNAVPGLELEESADV